MNVETYAVLVALVTFGVTGLMGWGTFVAGNKSVSTDADRLVKRRLFVSAASLGVILALSGLTTLIAGVQAAHGNPEDSAGVVVGLLLMNLPRLLAFVGCLYCVYTYYTGSLAFTAAGCLVLLAGALVSVLLMVFLGTLLLWILILVTFVIWLTSFLYLRKLGNDGAEKKRVSDGESGDDGAKHTIIPPSPTDKEKKTVPTSIPHKWGDRETSPVVEVSLWGNKGKKGWLPALAPVRIGQTLLSELCSDGASAPALAFTLDVSRGSSGKVWTLVPASDARVLLNGAVVVESRAVSPGDRVALLPPGESDPAVSFAKVMVKTRIMAERES